MNPVQEYFNRVLSRVDGLQALLVTDRDGVVLIRAVAPSCPDIPSNSSFEAAFALASEQASKLRLGKNKVITAFYESHVVLHVNYLPVVLSMIASANVNTGLLLGIVPELKSALETIRTAVSSEESQN